MSTKDKAPTGGPWFRVPANLPALEPEEAAAWTVLLGLWHGGHDPSIGEMRRRTGWGAGRMTAFMGKVSAWAAENGAAMPDRRADLKRTLKSGGDGNVIGTAAERQRNVTGTVEAAEKADNKVSPERERNESGTGAECYRNDSRARAPSQSRFEKEEEGEVPPPPQPEAEPDWEAIQAKILGSLDEARDAEIDGYFTSPIDLPPPPPKPSPEPAPRKRAPDFGALFGGSATPKPQQPQAEPEEAGLPVDLDLLQMLTTRPDGAQATALGVATRWVRLLTSQGIDSPGDLQRYTVREVQMLPGMSAPSAGHVQAALEAWGGEMAKGGRELVDDLRRRVLRNDSSLTAAEKRQMDAANLRTSDIKKMSDYDVNTYAQRLDAARSRM